MASATYTWLDGTVNAPIGHLKRGWRQDKSRVLVSHTWNGFPGRAYGKHGDTYVRGHADPDALHRTCCWAASQRCVLVFLMFYFMRRDEWPATTGHAVWQDPTLKTKRRPRGHKVEVQGRCRASMRRSKELEEIRRLPERAGALRKLGARFRRACCCIGPPARAKPCCKGGCGEAGVPFFSISALTLWRCSWRVARAAVRDLFDQAKRAAPSIIFIDEIDALVAIAARVWAADTTNAKADAEPAAGRDGRLSQSTRALLSWRRRTPRHSLTPPAASRPLRSPDPPWTAPTLRAASRSCCVQCGEQAVGRGRAL